MKIHVVDDWIIDVEVNLDGSKIVMKRIRALF